MEMPFYVLGVYHCSENIMNGNTKGAYGNMIWMDGSGNRELLCNAYSSGHHKDGNFSEQAFFSIFLCHCSLK